MNRCSGGGGTDDGGAACADPATAAAVVDLSLACLLWPPLDPRLSLDELLPMSALVRCFDPASKSRSFYRVRKIGDNMRAMFQDDSFVLLLVFVHPREGII